MDFDQCIVRVANGVEIIELAPGIETLKVVRVGEWVYKFRIRNIDRCRLQLHQALFGDKSGYAIIGEGECAGESGLILKQPYIEMLQGSKEEAQRQLVAELIGKFGKVLMANDEMWSGGYWLDDLKSGNIGIDATSRKYAVIDCLISKSGEAYVKQFWHDKGIPFREDYKA